MKHPRHSRIYSMMASLIVLLLNFTPGSIAQEGTAVPTTKRTDYKNTIKVNITSPILYNSAFMVGYERVIKKYQTLNISGGYLEFPISLNLPDSITLGEQKSKSGYNIVVDYRFYLERENRNPAPHGIYLAPFLSLHYFESGRNFSYRDSTGAMKEATTANKINFFTIGGQLGYQFVIKKRFVIDAAFLGPGITRYSFKVKLDGDLNSIDRESITAKIIQALKEKVPLLDDLTSDNEVSGSGVETFWSVGFRYNLSVGFRF